jgi:hypothetical protein
MSGKIDSHHAPMNDVERVFLSLALEAGVAAPKFFRIGKQVLIRDSVGGKFYDLAVVEIKDPRVAVVQRSFDVEAINQIRANAEGWKLVDVQGMFLDIQPDDNDPTFPDSLTAREYVIQEADSGCHYHLDVLRHITRVNKRRHEEDPSRGGMCFMYLRTWKGDQVESKKIVRVRSDYDEELGPFGQDAIRCQVGPNQDLCPLESSTMIPDLTFENDQFKFAPMEVKTNTKDYPIGCVCSACGTSFPVDPSDGENLKTIIVSGRRVNVARCTNCGALAHKPKPRSHG